MNFITSFFNPGLSKNLLKRFWPMWAVYLAGMLLFLPVSLTNMDSQADRAWWVLNSGILLVYGAAVAAPFIALAAYGFLYQNRS